MDENLELSQYRVEAFILSSFPAVEHAGPVKNESPQVQVKCTYPGLSRPRLDESSMVGRNRAQRMTSEAD